MAGNAKVELFGETLIDLTSDTVSPDTLLEGYTAHNSQGDLVVGTIPFESDEEPMDDLWLPKDENTIFLLVDCDKIDTITQIYPHIHYGSGTTYVTVGHLEDFEFIADSTRTTVSSSKRLDLSAYTGRVVVKFEIPTTITAVQIRGYNPATAFYSDNGTFKILFPILSVAWNVPRLTSNYSLLTNSTKRFVLSCVTTPRSTSESINNFASSTELEYLDLSKWTEPSATTSFLSSTFGYMYQIRKLKLPSEIQLSKVTNLSSSFYACWFLEKLPIILKEAPVTTTCATMFANCNSLTQIGNTPNKIDLSQMVTSSKVTAYNSMFENCYKVTEIDVSGLNFAGATTIASMFSNCRTLKKVTVDFSTISTKLTTLASVFSSCMFLTELPLLKNILNTTNVTTTGSMFNACMNVAGDLDLTITTTTAKLVNTSSMFNNCYKLESIDMTGWDFSKVTNCTSMFSYCYRLKEIPAQFKTMTYAFTSTNASSLFRNCTDLTEIDISHMNLSSVTSVSYMFYYCVNCVTLNLNGVNMGKATTASNPFVGMSSLTNVYCEGTTLPPVSFSLSSSNKLTYDSILAIINALPTVSSTKTLTLHATTKALLSADDIAIATAKKWTIA